MLKDLYGCEVSTASADARDAYDDGVFRFLAGDGGVAAAFQRAVDADEDFALAHLGLGRLAQMLGEGPKAAAALARARAAANGLTARETAHLGAFGHLLEGRGPQAYAAIRAHLTEHPRDAMAAQTCMGVFGMIGFSGKAGREAEQLAFTTSLAPHYGDDGWFLCQHGFANLEAGRLAEAEPMLEASLAANPRNANAAHIRAHLYYENGEPEAGYRYLDAWRDGYDREGALHCHVSWHVALWALAAGDMDKMWAVIDADLAPDRTLSPPLNVLTDLAALLYRAELAGADVPPERWRAVSAYAAARFPDPGIAFGDAHAALAHAMAGEADALKRIIADARGPAAEIVRFAAEGFGALAAGRWAEAVAALVPAAAEHERLGGSRAQRDLIELALAGALLRLGRAEEARRLLALRRPHAAPGRALAGLDG